MEWSDAFITSFAREVFEQLDQAEDDADRNDFMALHPLSSSPGPTASPFSSQPVSPSTTTYPMAVKRRWVSASLVKAFCPSRMSAFETERVRRQSGVGKRPKGKARATLDLGRGTQQFGLREVIEMANQAACKRNKNMTIVDLVNDSDEECEVIDLTL